MNRSLALLALLCANSPALPQTAGLEPAPPEAPAAAQQDPAQDPQARRFAEGGDLRKIVWQRPWTRARDLAREQGRVLLVKPILGGSNAPAPDGVPCGGEQDCEGSW